jgi:hypothetical protein
MTLRKLWPELGRMPHDNDGESLTWFWRAASSFNFSAAGDGGDTFSGVITNVLKKAFFR